jgi:ParB-like chromosome segregation protein Spo0J
MTTATASLASIRPSHVAIQHEIDEDKVAAIIAHVRSVGSWDLPPVLVLESEGNGHEILDGHHRSIAAKRLLSDIDGTIDMPERIPAYVVPIADYCRVLAAHFGDETPNRLSDLDEHILVDGSPYAGR